MYEISIKIDDSKDFPLYTNIVDDGTYVVGGKTFQAGDTLELSDEEKASLDQCKKMEDDLRSLRQWIVDEILKSDRTFLPHIQSKVHALNMISAGVRAAMSTLLLSMSRRLGGVIPVVVDKDLSKFTVRTRRPTDTLNYVSATIFDNLQLTELQEPKELAAILDPNRAHTKIDLSITREYEFQTLSIADTTVDNTFLSKISEFLKEFPRPTPMLVMAVSGDKMVHFTPFQSARPSQTRWEGITKFAHDRKVDLAGVLAPAQPQRGKPEDPRKITVNFSQMWKQGDGKAPNMHTQTYMVDVDTVEMEPATMKTFEWKPDEPIKALLS